MDEREQGMQQQVVIGDGRAPWTTVRLTTPLQPGEIVRLVIAPGSRYEERVELCAGPSGFVRIDSAS